MNLLSFLAGEYKYKGNGEYAGPCPRCGGVDRFLVWPGEGTTGRYLCRQCEAQGDGIQFLRDFHGMGYHEAREALRLPTSSAGQRKNGACAATAWEPKEARQPSTEWQAAAEKFLSVCHRRIACEAAAAFLQGRGLSLDTARRFQLGWHPADRFDAPEAWGLEPWKNSNGNPCRLFLPAGAVIPIRRRAGIMALNMGRHRVPFFFAGNKAGAEYACWGFLRQYLETARKRWSSIVKAHGDTG